MRKLHAILIFLIVAAPVSAQVPSYVIPSIPPPLTSFCPQLSLNLYRGLSDYYTGGQVSDLQRFLHIRYGNQAVTGYFGAYTAMNVARFQAEQGLRPVTGGVGPLTRAAIAQVCGDGSGGGNLLFTATPTSGQAPLGVVFNVGTDTADDAQKLYIDFGDGQTGKLHPMYCFAAPCSPALSTNHAYVTPGTYVARLYRDNNYCPWEMYCTLMYREPTPLGSLTVTVYPPYTISY